MYRFAKNFRILKSFVQSKNFRTQLRKRGCVLKTRAKSFTEKKLSPIVKTFARKLAKSRAPLPTAKKVDPLPLRGIEALKIDFEPLPLPKGFRSIDRGNVWIR